MIDDRPNPEEWNGLEHEQDIIILEFKCRAWHLPSDSCL